MNRRNFCTGVISTVFLKTLIADAIIGIANSEAALTGGAVENYICFWMSGGVERSWFDGILTPNGSSDNLGLGANVYSAPSLNGPAEEWIHRVTNTKVNNKFYLPYLWESILPDASGNNVAMKDLAVNTAIIRGVHTGLTFDAHAQNEKIMQVPFPEMSILGHIADNSNGVSIPAVLSSGRFISEKNKYPASVGAEANAYDIFRAVQFERHRNNAAETNVSYTQSPTAILGLGKVDNIVTSFINSLTSQMPTRKKQTFEVMMDNRKEAVKLISAGFGAIKSDYEVAFEKYFTLINLVMNPTSARQLDGFDNKVLGGSGDAVNYRLFEGISRTNVLGNYNSDFTVLDGLKTAECNFMASAFAKAEVYLKYKVTNVMQFEIANITKIEDRFSINSPGTAYDFGFDSHFMGQVIRGAALSRLYQGFAACMLHLKAQVGSTIWNSTLAHLRSEFNRGQAYDRGSDHNIRSCIETFFSGAIKDGPIVAGNIEYSQNSKCSGDGAIVAETKNEKISSKHIYSTIGTLMGYTPSRNHPSVLTVEAGKILSNVSAPKNVLKES